MQEIVSFLTVLVVDICVAGGICVLYATGIRLWQRSAISCGDSSHTGARIGSVCCFVTCAAIVVFALYLMIPAFH